jgi:hypothetical protein
MAVTQLPLPAGFGNAVSGSQPQKWLTERFAYLPQVRRFFDEKWPRSTQGSRNFQGS